MNLKSRTFDKIFTRFVNDKEQDGKRDQQHPYVYTDGGTCEQGVAKRPVDNESRQKQFGGDPCQHQPI